jgi:hypothetical protein
MGETRTHLSPTLAAEFESLQLFKDHFMRSWIRPGETRTLL